MRAIGSYPTMSLFVPKNVAGPVAWVETGATSGALDVDMVRVDRTGDSDIRYDAMSRMRPSPWRRARGCLGTWSPTAGIPLALLDPAAAP